MKLRTSSSFLFRFSLLTIALLSSSIFAQQSSKETDVPVFKSTSRLVVLDVVVTDRYRKPVSGLTKDDFIVTENGVPQKITQFEATTERSQQQPVIKRTDDKSVAVASPIPVQSSTIFVLDELNTKFEEAVFSRSSIIKYLQRQPEQLAFPAMIIAVTNTDFRLLHDYTQDRKELIKTLRERQPAYPWKMAKGFAKERLATCLVALQQIAAANAGRPGRKNIVWVGRGFPSVVFSDEIPDDQRATILNAVNRTTTRLLESRVTVYTIDPTMTSSGSNASMFMDEDGNITTSNVVSDPWNGDVNFANFGPATGGRAFRSRNDIDREIGESVEDSVTYYTLAYVPTNRSDDDAKYRRIRIKMERPGLIARTRDGYYSVEAKPTQGMIALDMSQAAQNPFPYTGIEFKVLTSLNKTDPTKANCMVHVEPRGLRWIDASNGDLRAEVEIAVASFSAENKMLGYDVHKFGSTNRLDQRKDLFQMPARFPMLADLPKGTQRLRFVVRDQSSGKIGTFEIGRDEIK